jgi:putative hydrolase of the HAD superfamily
MTYKMRRQGCPLGAVETWIFDLDNTLYPASSRLFEQVQARMNEYICTRLSVSLDEVDLSGGPANPERIAALNDLSGRKLVYTNGSVPHAENLLKHLGITHFIHDIFDIVASEFAPKPAMAPFRAFVSRYGVEPMSALMVEDMAKNLAPAAELGMTTAWVRTGVDWAATASDADYIHYVVEDLAGFLGAAAALEREARR